MKHIDLWALFKPHNTKRFALVAAEYVECSKTLQTLDLSYDRHHCSHEVREMVSLLLRALSRNTSVTELITFNQRVRWAGVAFRELLTRTQTLQQLEISGPGDEAFEESQISVITSGLANNKSLRAQKFVDWRAADLDPALMS